MDEINFFFAVLLFFYMCIAAVWLPVVSIIHYRDYNRCAEQHDVFTCHQVWMPGPATEATP